MEITDYSVPILEAVGDFFSNPYASAAGYLVVFILAVWLPLKYFKDGIAGYQKAKIRVDEAEEHRKAEELRVQQEILKNLQIQNRLIQERQDQGLN